MIQLAFLLFTIVLSSSGAHAQWLCREASSIRNGHIITACGVGQAQTLAEAREKSREGAIEEFKRLCQLSRDCFEFDYSVTPKRTDCEAKGAVHVCYRAIDFEISDRKRRSVAVDLRDLEAELKQKSAEIQSIQNRIEKIDEIRRTEEVAEQRKRELEELQESLNRKEAETLRLQDLNSKETIAAGEYSYLHEIFQNSARLSFHIWSSKLTADSENDLLLLLSVEKRPLTWIGFQIYGGFASGRLENQKEEVSQVPTQGTRNSIQTFNGPVAYSDMGGALLLYPGWRGVYLKYEAGQVNGRKETYTATYNNSGVGTVQKTQNGISSNYSGFHIGFDTRNNRKGWGFFLELGGRRLADQSWIGAMGGVGLNYGF